MAIEQTLSIIKPDAVAKGYVDEICKRLEDAGIGYNWTRKVFYLDQEKAGGLLLNTRGSLFSLILLLL